MAADLGALPRLLKCPHCHGKVRYRAAAGRAGHPPYRLWAQCSKCGARRASVVATGRDSFEYVALRWNRMVETIVAQKTHICTRPAITGDGEIVRALLDGYTLHKCEDSPYLTDEANAAMAWVVKRQKRPYCDAEGVRHWHGATPAEAIAKARAAIEGRTGE